MALAAAVERYGVHHPVLDDPELHTWSAYAVRAWPTLAVVDPEGYLVAQLSGEGHAPRPGRPGRRAGRRARGQGHPASRATRRTSRRRPSRPPCGSRPRWSGCPTGNLLVADAGHHSLAELAPDGETLVRRIGSGERGLVDGAAERGAVQRAERAVPAAPGRRRRRRLRPRGRGHGQPRPARRPAGRRQRDDRRRHRRPVDAGRRHAGAVQPVGRRLVRRRPWPWRWRASTSCGGSTRAAARSRCSPGRRTRACATGRPRRRGSPRRRGCAVDGDRLWLVDSETSALRSLRERGGGHPHRPWAVRLRARRRAGQRGAAAAPAGRRPCCPDGSVAVCDTYNGAVRRYDPATAQVTTLATGLREPSGASSVDGPTCSWSSRRRTG